MKAFLVCVLALATGTFAKINCPLGQNINGWDSKDLLFPHKDCDKYYICVHGEPVEQFCPIGLLYNNRIRQCDYPQNVKCSRSDPIEEENITAAKIVEAPTVITSKANINCPLGQNINGWDSKDLLFPHKDCDKYYICVHGEPVEQFCPIGLLYNNRIRQCDYPQNVKCSRSEPIEEDTETVAKLAGPSVVFTELANVKCRIVDLLSWKKDVLLPHWDCDKFYQCANGVAVPRPCPDGLYFNFIVDTCDYPENVKCFRGSDADVETSVVDVPSVSAALAEHKCRVVDILGIERDVLFSHWDCDKYYICDNGAAVARPCPESLYFNTFTNRCDYPQNVKCSRSDPIEEETNTAAKIVEAPTEITSKANINCPLGQNINGWDSKDLLFPHKDCDKYYICVHGEPVEQFCPIGLLYNNRIRQCDYPQNVKCSRSDPIEEETITAAKIVEAPTVITSKANINCPLGQNINGWDSKDLLFPHKDCDKYYICVHGEPVEQFCPIGLLYNNRIRQCDYPQNVKCSRSDPIEEETNTAAKIVEAPTVITSKANINCPLGQNINGWDSKDLLFPHKDCDKYYICVHGEPVEQFCPIGLLYNYRIRQCDYPQNVKCSRSEPIEEDTETVAKLAGPSVVFTELANVKCRIVDLLSWKKDVLLPHWDCDKFYQCANGVAVPRPCPDGLYFNFIVDTCDYPENVKCFRGSDADVETSVVDVPSVSAALAEHKCRVVDILGIERDVLFSHWDCDKYYICDNGAAVARPCPESLYFNTFTNRCNYPQNVKCFRSNPIDQETKTAAKIDEAPRVITNMANINCPLGQNINGWDSKDLLFPHKDCDKYYICVHGEPVEQFCPIGLLYNNRIRQCDYPQNVKCF